MNIKLLFGFILVLVILVVVVSVNDSGSDINEEEVTDIIGQLNMSTAVDVGKSDEYIDLPSLDNGIKSLSVRNFTKDVDVVTWGEDTTFVIGSGIIDEDEAFQIFYYSLDKSISISILQEPVGDIRKVAEAKLVERLQVSPEKICTLNVSVTVPGFVSDTLSGKNLGLSFCPNSVEI